MIPTQRVRRFLDLARNNVRSGVESIEEIKHVFTECILDFVPEERVFLACALVDEVTIERFWGTFCRSSDDRPSPGALVSEWILNGATADGSATHSADSPARYGSTQDLTAGGRAIPPSFPD